MVAITGPAGTGKTTILRQVHKELSNAGYKVTLCAPTGKAARRIKEATGIEASTIHKLLEYPRPGDRDPNTGKPLQVGFPSRSRANPIDYDIVLCDEYAMVNHEVHRNLVDALPAGGVIRCFGDVNQLQPIETDWRMKDKPSPFMDMLERFPSVRLTTIHRQGEGSGITENAAYILAGRQPRKKDDFLMTFTEKPLRALEMYLRAHADPFDEQPPIMFDSLEHQIITPANKRLAGAHAINTAVQRIYRDFSMNKPIRLPRQSWDEKAGIICDVCLHDKIIWLDNNYDLDIMNGEQGIIEDIDHEFGGLTINFGDRVIEIPSDMPTTNKKGEIVSYDPRMSIMLAYAVTTHKSQGSEYQHVVYILNQSAMWMHCRSNFYTGVTRARTAVNVLADAKSLSNAVRRKESIADMKGREAAQKKGAR